MAVNHKVRSWIDSGHAVDALCGQDEYFLPNHTYYDHHAESLVLRQLCDWAEESGRTEEASQAFHEALRTHLEAGREDGVYSLVWTFMVSSLYREMPFALDIAAVDALLEQAKWAEGAAPQIAKFEYSMTQTARVRTLLRGSDGRHFDIEPWQPPARSTD